MDRIKRLSREILQEHKDEFGTDFVENKKTLDKISIIRSKGLKNELAGFITKFIKREIREKEEKEEQIVKIAESTKDTTSNKSQEIKAYEENLSSSTTETLQTETPQEQ